MESAQPTAVVRRIAQLSNHGERTRTDLSSYPFSFCDLSRLISLSLDSLLLFGESSSSSAAAVALGEMGMSYLSPSTSMPAVRGDEGAAVGGGVVRDC